MGLMTFSVQLDAAELQRLEAIASKHGRGCDEQAGELLSAALSIGGREGLAAVLVDIAFKWDRLKPHVREAFRTVLETLQRPANERGSDCQWTAIECLVRILSGLPPDERGTAILKAMQFAPESSFKQSINIGNIRALIAGCWEDRFLQPVPIGAIREYCTRRPSVAFLQRLSVMKHAKRSDLSESIDSLLLHLHRCIAGGTLSSRTDMNA